MQIKQAYKIFNIKKRIEKEDLKSIYKELILVNHPDRFMNKSNSIIVDQTHKILKINEAYAILLKQIDGSSILDCEDIFIYDFCFNVEYTKSHRHAAKGHPHHKDQKYRYLWYTIKGIQKDNQGLALRCWEKAFLGKYLFKDVRVTWAMMISYYSNVLYEKLLYNIENDLILLLPFNKSIKESNMVEENVIPKTPQSFLPIFGNVKNEYASISSKQLNILNKEIESMLINSLVAINELTNDKKCDLRKKRISGAINTPIEKKSSETRFGLRIIKNPIMNYSEKDLNNIWEQYFPNKKISHEPEKKILNK